MPVNLNLTGTPGKTYDLDAIEAESRVNVTKPLLVQVHMYNPELPTGHPNKSPNPATLQVGQIWLSKKVPTEEIL
jgi:hypothetical protein